MQDLCHLLRAEEYDIVSVDYGKALNAFKTTQNASDFLKMALPTDIANQ